MKKINKTLLKGLALTLGACSLLPLAACGNNDDGGSSKTQVWNAQNAYVTAQEQGFTGTFEEFLQKMSNIQNIAMNSNGELVFTLGDGTIFNLGNVKGSNGKDGAKGEAGKGIKNVTSAHDDERKVTVITITFTDDTSTSVDIPDGVAGADGTDGAKGDKGNDGAQGADGAKGEKGNDGAPGEKGDKGDNGNDGVGIATIEQDFKDRWGIVNKIKYVMTNGVTYTFDIGCGVAYGRQYDANNYQELKYLMEHGVSNIVLTGDIVVNEGPKYTLNFVATESVNYYSLDLNQHTIYGIILIDGDDRPVAMEIKNGQINTAEYAEEVYGLGTIYCTSAIKTFGNVMLNFDSITTYGHSFGLTTNGNSKGVELVASNCGFYAVDKTEKTSVGAYFPAGGHYDFTNCTFEGEMGANLKSGTYNFENCRFEGTSEYVAPVYSSGASVGSGSALIVSSSYGYTPNLDVTLRGCTLISANGYGLEEVSVAPENQDAGYTATITVDRNTRFSAAKGDYVSQNNVITFLDDSGSGDSGSEIVLNGSIQVRKSEFNEANLSNYVKEGYKIVELIDDDKNVVSIIEFVTQNEFQNFKDMISSSNSNKYIPVDNNGTVYIENAINVARTAAEVETFTTEGLKTFISAGVELNELSSTLFETNKYYLQQDPDSTLIEFFKVETVELYVSADGEGKHTGTTTADANGAGFAIINETGNMAKVSVAAANGENIKVEYYVITFKDGYIDKISDAQPSCNLPANENVIVIVTVEEESVQSVELNIELTPMA